MASALQLPSSQQALGLFVLFHGCGRKYTDWFNFPEEKVIVRYLLSRQYAILALQQQSGCWSQELHDNPDLNNAVVATTTMVKKYNLTGLPVFALGASSGG